MKKRRPWKTPKVTEVLDHGVVTLVDTMGSDAAIVQAARVSYGAGTKSAQEDTGLVRYLMRHQHTTPFEMCQLKFHIKCPIFVARLWHRHRTASINEVSARYSVLPEEYYVPELEHIQAQSTANKQGRGDTLEDTGDVQDIIKYSSKHSYEHYSDLLEQNLTRELARTVLPVNFYTEFYWSLNLHNLLHFLQLRLDAHAQYEIRVYAEAIAEIVKEQFPITWTAFEDYRLNSVNLSAQALTALKRMLKGEIVDQHSSGMSHREWNEFTKIFNGE